MIILIPIYSIFIYIAILLSFPRNSIMNNKYYVYVSSIFLGLVSVYVTYVTDLIYTDRSVYTKVFNIAIYTDLKILFQSISHEPLFLITTKIISELTHNEIYYYVMLHLLFLFFLILGLKKIKNSYLIVFSLFIFLNYTFYYGYILNGIRQGIAFACVIFLIGLLFEKKWFKAIAFSIIPVMFHYSSLPIIIIIFLVKYYNRILKLKYLFATYIVFSFLYIFDLQSIFVGFLNFDYLIEYSSTEMLSMFGEVNNINFLIFNTIFLLIFYYFYSKNKNDKLFLTMYKIYIVFSLYFILFGFVAYSNRIAAYSWLLIPIIIGLILENEKYRILVLPVLIVIFLLGIITGVPQYFTGIE